MEQTNELQPNVEKINGNKPDFSIQPIEGTPFTMVKTEQGYCLAMGKNMMSPWLATENDALEYCVNNHWNLVASMIEVYIGLRKLNNNTL